VIVCVFKLLNYDGILMKLNLQLKGLYSALLYRVYVMWFFCTPDTNQ